MDKILSLPLPAIGITVVLVWGLYRLLQVGRRHPNMPPGPPTLPIIGNLHQIPATGLYKKFKEWGDEYNGIFSLKFGPKTFIVLYDRKAIHDLVDKKGLLYAERPANYVADVITSGDSIVFASNTQATKAKRKIATHNFSPRLLDERASPVQDAEVTSLIYDLLETPDNFYKHFRRVTSSIACILVYGHRGPTYENFWGHAVYDALARFGEALEPGANPPVDEIPFLKHIPARFAPWKRRAQEAGQAMHAIWTEARRLVDERRALGERRNSLADRLLDEYDEKGSPMSKHAIDQLFGELVEGGAETTSSSMLTLMFCLARNPWVQKKAWKEIDALCGPDRMPQWADFDKLPYVNAIIKEGMRWRPAVATGIPRRVAADDWYEGMFIPKDSTIFIPIYAIQHSERDGYGDPNEFNPDRYEGFTKLANDYAGSADYTQRDHYGYGSGRRMCPGIHLAERNQWRIAAKVLWAFEIQEPTDPVTGEVRHLDPGAYTEGLLHAPLPYTAVFKPRSKAHVETIRKEYASAIKTLKQWE